MKDFMKNEIEVGDKVVYLTHSRTSSALRVGIVSRLLTKMVEIDDGKTRKTPDKLIVVSRHPRGLDEILNTIKYIYASGKKPIIYVSRAYAHVLTSPLSYQLIYISNVDMDKRLPNSAYIGSFAGAPVFVDDELHRDFLIKVEGED